MDQIREDLWQTSLELTGGVNHCGFLLLRPEGNVLFYHAPNEDDFERIAELGGIEHHILSHRHETDPSPDLVKEAFGTRLCTDALEGPAICKQCQVDVTFDRADAPIQGKFPVQDIFTHLASRGPRLTGVHHRSTIGTGLRLRSCRSARLMVQFV